MATQVMELIEFVGIPEDAKTLAHFNNDIFYLRADCGSYIETYVFSLQEGMRLGKLILPHECKKATRYRIVARLIRAGVPSGRIAEWLGVKQYQISRYMHLGNKLLGIE